jgi:hypothetical protein
LYRPVPGEHPARFPRRTGQVVVAFLLIIAVVMVGDAVLSVRGARLRAAIRLVFGALGVVGLLRLLSR